MKNADQPAHPYHTAADGQLSVDPGKSGLTKREYFAGLAMSGILTNSDILKPYMEKADMEKIFLGVVVASESIRMADELLNQLDKTKSKVHGVETVYKLVEKDCVSCFGLYGPECFICKGTKKYMVYEPITKP